MPNAAIKHKLYHNDDIVLSFQYPEDISPYTDLSTAEIEERVEIFGRMFLDDIISKERKEFKIEFDEEQDKWVFYLLRKVN